MQGRGRAAGCAEVQRTDCRPPGPGGEPRQDRTERGQAIQECYDPRVVFGRGGIDGSRRLGIQLAALRSSCLGCWLCTGTPFVNLCVVGFRIFRQLGWQFRGAPCLLCVLCCMHPLPCPIALVARSCERCPSSRGRSSSSTCTT